MTRKAIRRTTWVAGVSTAVIAIGGMAFAFRGGSAPAVAYHEPVPVRGTVTEQLVAPPMVPAPITRDYASKVVVTLNIEEKTMRLANGATYHFWTFGGTVPGKFIRVREGDRVELHLNNPKGNQMAHNIDLHAVNGPHGGGMATITLPGHESVFTFTALNPGLYVYHCAMPGMVGMHIANGMFGMILVEPRDGLPKVDHEYYVMQSEIYTRGARGDTGLQHFDYEKAVNENPTYVVFNGSVGALMGEHALQAKTGETVRIFIGNAGPNLISSFHMIGEIFDNVYADGGTMVTQHNVQTTLIPAGGAAIVEFRTNTPGDYTMVDHSIFRATQKGAMATLHVTGAGNPVVYNAGAVKEMVGK